MKLRNRILCLLTILCLLGIFSDTHAAAADIDPSQYVTQEAAVTQLRKALTRHDEVITAYVKSDTKLTAAMLYDAAVAHTGVPNEGDYIRYNTRGYESSASVTTIDGKYYYTFTFVPVWLHDAAQEQQVAAAINDILGELNLKNAHDYDKVLGVYNWITEEVQYDFDNYDDNAYTLKHSTYAAMIDRCAVCQGYATLLYRMLLSLGVDCRYISGRADNESHAWVIIKLDGKYYNADPTWDRDLKGHYRYFLIPNSNFATHQRSSEYNTQEFLAQHPMSETPYVRNVAASGKLNGDMAWVLDGDTGTLTVSGTGAIPSYRFSEPPWYSHRESVSAIVVSEGITEVGERAFYWCTNCTEVTLPDSLIAIREYGFNNLRALQYITLPPNLEILEFCAFSECTALQTITIPDSVHTVGTSVFSNCTALKGARLGSGMTYLPDSMFGNDAKLSGVVLPPNLTTIGDTVFINSGLESIRIPATVTSIGVAAFSGCKWLEEFTVEEGNKVYKSIDGVLFSADKKTLICYPACKYGRYTVPEGTELIGYGAFRSAYHMTGITFCSTLKEIDDYAFIYCSILNEVTFPKNITRIGENAFRGCGWLVKITFQNPDVQLDSGAFSDCDVLQNITLPARLKEIPSHLFFDCGYLNNVVIPSTVTKIGSSAFLNCDKLTSITIPGNVKSIGRQAFDFCNVLKTVDIQEGVQTIEEYAFRNCPALTRVMIPRSVSSIGKENFDECPNVTLDVYCGTKGQQYANIHGISNSVSHPYINSTVVAPTCTQQGYTRYLCSCGEFGYNSSYVAANGHTYGSWTVTKAATCTAAGSQSRICHECGYEEIQSIPKLAHTPNSPVTENPIAATCEASGSYEEVVYCKVCKTHEISRTKRTTSPLGHKDKNKDFVCDVCSADLCTDHTLITIKGYAATCTADGLTDGKKCSNCGEIVTPQTIIPAKGHTAVTDKAVAATCTANGLTEGKHCSVCGFVITKQVTVPAMGHTIVIDSAVAATCTKSGLTEGKHCSVCGTVLTKQTAVPAKGHNFGQWGVTVEPNCTAQGEERRSCGSCDAFEARTLDKLPHEPAPAVRENEISPGCETDGSYDSVIYCAQCLTHEISRSKRTVAALGHKDTNKDFDCDVCGADLCTNHKAVTIKGYAATCTTDGLTDGSKCSNCGEILSSQARIPATGHTPVTDPAIAPTCTAAGLSEGKHCKVCNAVTQKQTVIPATGHTAVIDKAVAATCSASGLTEGKHCSVCGFVITKQNAVPALGHSYGAWTVTKAATCTAEGTEQRICENCKDTQTRSIAKIAHVGGAAVKEHNIAPTCTVGGSYEMAVYCTSCKIEMSRTKHTLAALGHKDNDKNFDCDVCGADLCTNHKAVTVKGYAATCTTDGLTDGSKCSNCGEIILAQTVIPATGHTAVTDKAVAATCTASGLTEGKHCTVCGFVIAKQNTVPALGHSYGAWTVTKAATCTAEGTEQRICENCKDTQTRSIAKIAHIGGAAVKEHNIAPTCTVGGSYEMAVYCTSCKIEMSRTKHTLAALGHKDNDKNFDCDVCGADLCTNHKAVTLKGYAATCTADGLTDGSKCSNCGEIILAQSTIPAKGHTAVIDKAVAATCTASGLTEGKHCSVCGFVIAKQNAVPALGHSYGAWTVTKAATCTAEGTEQRVCENCKDTQTRSIAKVAHIGGAAVKEHNVEATCTVGGSYEMAVYCTSCKIEMSRTKHTLAALGHKDNDKNFDCDVCGADLCTNHKAVTIKGYAATCTTDGLTDGSKCSNCGEIILAQSTIPAKGHTAVIDKAVAATCTASGLTEGKHCSVCGFVIEKQNVVPALGHDFKFGICSVCGAPDPNYVAPTPTVAPTVKPTPTVTPTVKPTPTVAPTVKPTPTVAPTVKPTPTIAPTVKPTPTVAPTIKPTPTVTPTVKPTPTVTPTVKPTPTVAPTVKPTPTVTPTVKPTPTVTPTVKPTPTVAPTVKPTPTVTPTVKPTPTVAPTVKPTPTVTPTVKPTPTVTPTVKPTPTVAPTVKPTPTVAPTVKPTPTVAPTVKPTPTPTPVTNPFTDVKGTDWFYAPVMWAVTNNVTGGTSATTFSPDASCTRGQVVTFLWAAAGRPAPVSTDNPFTDVSEKDWFYQPVLWAVENGITAGTSPTKFSPDASCTRAQVVTFLYAAQGRPEIGGSGDFRDVKDTDWFAKPVVWAAQNAITGGVGNNSFGPDRTCTRGQIVTFLYKASMLS